ncbi:hypothetical protein ACFVRB_21430 [Streptomyces nojiriensis]|uniref:hypothetical protein n=1 Tax=Streptomyces nojiriensis TaxID=66374 RepID=UPI0036DD4D40
MNKATQGLVLLGDVVLEEVDFSVRGLCAVQCLPQLVGEVEGLLLQLGQAFLGNVVLLFLFFADTSEFLAHTGEFFLQLGELDGGGTAGNVRLAAQRIQLLPVDIRQGRLLRTRCRHCCGSSSPSWSWVPPATCA